MIPVSSINSTLRQFKRLRREHPELSTEEAQSVLVAASNDAVAQALYSLGSDVSATGGLKLVLDTQAAITERETTEALRTLLSSNPRDDLPRHYVGEDDR